jgi:AraC family transcriptional regulator
MAGPQTGAIEVLSQLKTADARVQVVNYHFFEAADGRLRGEGRFRLDLCLSARHRNTRGCYVGVWKPHRFEPVGELFVVHPDADLIARSDEASTLTSVVCDLEAEPVMALFNTVPQPSDSLLMASLDVRNERMKYLLRWMAEEARRPSFASEMMCELMVSQLRIELIRHGDVVLGERAQGGLAPWQLHLIEERLNEACAAPSLVELAALCRISVRQLSRGFRASKDCAIGAYVNARQVAHAKRMLAEGESVAAIAARLGFATSSSFGCAFRRETGVTPGQYRERLLRH